MNLSIGLSLTRPSGPLGFNPASLFASGEVGAWYDPSDSTTVFQDAAGTTAAGVGDPVGLMLDKSKGLTLGADVVVNGDFATTADWVVGSDWDLSNGYAENTTGLNTHLRPSVGPLTIGKWYKVSFDLIATTGQTRFRPNFVTTVGQVLFTTTGSKTAIFEATGTIFSFFENSGLPGTIIDNVVIRELPGNHATQTTSAARPVLQQSGATPSGFGSELATNGTFDTDTAWTKATGWTISGGEAVFDGSPVYANISQNMSLVQGKQYRITFDLTGSLTAIRLGGPTAANNVAENLTTGAISIVVTCVGSDGTLVIVSSTGNAATIDNISVQEVTAWTGGLRYLDFDGVDDFMDSTFASAQAQPNTLSAAFKHDSIVGTRTVFDNVVSGQRHLLRSNSSAYYEMYGGVFLNGGTPTVSDRVAVAHFDSTSSSLRFEGVVAVSGSAGTLTWPSIRMGASTTPNFFLDGRIYSFVGVNRTLTAGEITDLETYLAAKSGVTL